MIAAAECDRRYPARLQYSGIAFRISDIHQIRCRSPTATPRNSARMRFAYAGGLFSSKWVSISGGDRREADRWRENEWLATFRGVVKEYDVRRMRRLFQNFQQCVFRLLVWLSGSSAKNTRAPCLHRVDSLLHVLKRIWSTQHSFGATPFPSG